MKKEITMSDEMIEGPYQVGEIKFKTPLELMGKEDLSLDALKEMLDKHLGPGPHPSGSPQSVHGSGGKGGKTAGGDGFNKDEWAGKEFMQRREDWDKLSQHEKDQLADAENADWIKTVTLERFGHPDYPPFVGDQKEKVPDLEELGKLLKHMGPGPHPSGSSQAAHGGSIGRSEKEDVRGADGEPLLMWATELEQKEQSDIRIRMLEPLFNKQADDSTYRKVITNLVRMAWRGDVDQVEFEKMLTGEVNTGINLAWVRGLAKEGITEEEATDEERKVLDDELSAATVALLGFTAFVFGHLRADGHKFQSLRSRIEIWVNRYNAVFNKITGIAGENKKKKWRWNPAKDHCGDCAHYHEKIYRKSVWMKYGIWPQSTNLECNGWQCGCDWDDTDEKATPGRPKSPANFKGF